MAADDKDRKPVYFRGKLVGAPGQPLQFTERVEVAGADAVETSPLCKAIGETLRAYRKAAHALIEGQYASVRALVPPHLRSPCHIYVLCCPDGILVRYDLAGEEEPKVRMSDCPDRLAKVAPMFSEQVFHLPDDVNTYVPEGTGPGLTLGVVDANGNFVEHARLHPMIYAGVD